MGDPTWMYCRAADGGVAARVFDADALPAGWFDSPAALRDPALESMTKRELEDFARHRFGIDLDRRRSAVNLRRQVRDLIDRERTGGGDGDGA